MKISDIVRTKGDRVVTIRSDQSVADLLALLNEHGIGAVVVSDDGAAVGGIVSERDVVRHLHAKGQEVLGGPVQDIMTKDVYTCRFEDQLADLESTMTERRIRHVPIVEDGKLCAIVSIGDVVKHRISDLAAERDHLVDYINK
ncbi:MAG: CBS domain-containing protein [Actinomycetia bacterium]|nr:CBS domain-containing protein [Actinomycetes bacterium]